MTTVHFFLQICTYLTKSMRVLKSSLDMVTMSSSFSVEVTDNVLGAFLPAMVWDCSVENNGLSFFFSISILALFATSLTSPTTVSSNFLLPHNLSSCFFEPTSLAITLLILHLGFCLTTAHPHCYYWTDSESESLLPIMSLSDSDFSCEASTYLYFLVGDVSIKSSSPLLEEDDELVTYTIFCFLKIKQQHQFWNNFFHFTYSIFSPAYFVSLSLPRPSFFQIFYLVLLLCTN